MDDLRVAFRTGGQWQEAVAGVDLRVAAGQTLCLVGESGSGKSVSALAMMDLLDPRQTQVKAKTLQFAGRDLQRMGRSERRALCGRSMAMVFQDPMTALNPYLTIGAQLTEVAQLHLGLSAAQARQRAVEGLIGVGVTAPETRLSQHPHQLSGGMRQRVLVAMALLGEPKLLFADEPTTALDVTIQAQVLALLRREQQQRGLGMVFVTHDLGVVAAVADAVAVLYAGQIQEQADVDTLFASPRHPYTIGLLGSLPSRAQPGQRLQAIAGLPPLLHQRPAGCAFAPRCPLATDRCHSERPAWQTLAPGHGVRCFYPEAAAGLAARRTPPPEAAHA